MHLHRKRVAAAALIGCGSAFLIALVAFLLLANPSSATPSDGSHKVTICHATSSATNPFNKIAVDVASTGLSNGGHYAYNPNNGKYNIHEDDIIPAFTFTDKDNVVHNVPGQNLTSMYGNATGQDVLANSCTIPDNPPVDACPNIDGDQSEVPAGYVVDGRGNCVLEPPAEDVCPNIDGDQSEVPSGYILVSGACVRPPVADVCPNVDGDQATVPDGLLLDAQGNCVAPPATTDLCPNVEGSQTTLPAGTTQDASGNCIAVAGASDEPASDDSGNNPSADDTTDDTPDDVAVAGENSPPDTTASSSELPFTGLGVLLLAALGASLVIVGAWLEFGVRRAHARHVTGQR
jgi:hypothetical protein